MDVMLELEKDLEKEFATEEIDVENIDIDEIDKILENNKKEDEIIETINKMEGLTLEEEIKREIKREINKKKTTIKKEEITKIMMTLLSSKEIKDLTVVEIENENLDNIDGGLYDRRLGTIDDSIKCEECKQDVMRCPGHFGHIKLYKKIIHPKYMELIVKILNIFSDEEDEETNKLKLLVTEDDIDKYKNLSYLEKFKMISENSIKGDNRKPVRQYKLEKGNIIYIFRKTKMSMSLEGIETLFSKIDKIDLEKIGIYTDIKNLILEYIPVLPINLRPYNIQNGKVAHHDFTLIYQQIITANNLKNEEKLIQAYNNLIDNKEISGCKNLNGTLYNSLKSTIDSKQGLLRGGIFGKRGDYSGRTVLSPDPNIKINEIGVPKMMAKILTTQENITRYNMEYIKKLYEKNQIKFLIKKGKKINIYNNTMPKNMKFEPGDVIKRFIKNGDPLIFNRQPTLHKQSMIGLLVKLIDGMTFRLNPAITTGLNADFDGDEGNINVPQSQEAKIEAIELMNIENCIISEQTSKPITVLVQDVVLGAYLLTNKNIIIPKELFFDCILIGKVQYDHINFIQRIVNYHKENNNIDFINIDTNITKNNVKIIEENIKKYIFTGKMLLSTLLPVNFNYIRNYENNNIIIENGLLINGYLNKDILSTGHNSIVQTLYYNYGKKITNDFMSNIQPVVHKWLKEYGFTIGYQDCLISDDVQKKITKVLETTTKKTTITVTGDPHIDMKNEAEINQQLNNSRNLIAKHILQSNDNIDIELYDELYTNMIIYYDDNYDFSLLTPYISQVDLSIENKYFGNNKIVNLKQIHHININVPKEEFIITMYNGTLFNLPLKNIISIVLQDKYNNLKSYLFNNQENPFKSMLVSKSKGTNLNISQISGSVGQQNISSQRIPFSITNNTRVLPHFSPNDFSPSSRGFCSNSYLYGLDPLEFFFSSMGGREGLTDTAIKTSETGYLQRRITAFMREFVSFNDGSIRNSNGNIIQFLYGNNGFSTDKMTKINDNYTFTNIHQHVTDIINTKFDQNSYIYNIFEPLQIPYFLVSLYSLLLTKPKADINIIFSDNIPNTIIDFIKSLNIQYIIVDLSLFNLFSFYFFTQYNKCLLVDVYMIFTKNVDHLFSYPFHSFPFNLPSSDFSNPFYPFKNNFPSKLDKIIPSLNYYTPLFLFDPNTDFLSSLSNLPSHSDYVSFYYNQLFPLIFDYLHQSNLSLHIIPITYNYYVMYDPSYYQLSNLQYQTKDIFIYNFNPSSDLNLFSHKFTDKKIIKNMIIFNTYYSKLINDYPQSQFFINL